MTISDHQDRQQGSAGADKTVGHVLDAASAYLSGRGIKDAGLCCELLCERLLRCKRLEVALHRDEVMPERYLEAMRRAVRRLAAHEPVQYVLGEWDFRGHRLVVDQRALIPRPETEQLVQRVLDWEPLWKRESPAIADIGTGSGCIAISLAVERPEARLLAIDVSDQALALASENAQRLGVAQRVKFVPLGLADVLDEPCLDAIVANLPYIPSGAMAALPLNVQTFEPKLALDGGMDGLEIVREVIADASMALREGGGLFLEIGEEQGAAVEALLGELEFEQIRVHHDLTQRPRFATAVWHG